MHASRLLVATVLAALLGTTTNVSARVVRVACVDGSVPIEGGQYCDVDGMGDGVCTFALPVFCEVTCSTQTVTVPVRHRRTVRVGGTKYILRCRLPVCDEEHHCSRVTRSCEDGVLGPMQEGQCDLDEQANGVCTFGFFCLEVCGPLVDSVVVPVGDSRVVQRANLPRIDVTQYTLRCVPSS